MVLKVLIKLAATWEGIAAMKELEAEAGEVCKAYRRKAKGSHQHLEKSSLRRASLAT